MSIEVTSYRAAQADGQGRVEKGNGGIFLYGYGSARISDGEGNSFDIHNMRLKCTVNPDAEGNTAPRWFIDFPVRKVTNKDGQASYLPYFHATKFEGEGQNPTLARLTTLLKAEAEAYVNQLAQAPAIA